MLAKVEIGYDAEAKLPELKPERIAAIAGAADETRSRHQIEKTMS